MYLGVKAVIAKSFARIHRGNLINFGILPLAFSEPSDFEKIERGDEIEIPNLRSAVASGNTVDLIVKRTGDKITIVHNLTPRQVEIILAGGLLNYIRRQSGD